MLSFEGSAMQALKKNTFVPPADNLTVNEQLTGPHAAGVNSILPKEHGSQFFYLPIIRHSDEEVSQNFTALMWPKREHCLKKKKMHQKCCLKLKVEIKNSVG